MGKSRINFLVLEILIDIQEFSELQASIDQTINFQVNSKTNKSSLNNTKYGKKKASHWFLWLLVDPSEKHKKPQKKPRIRVNIALVS